MKQALLIDTDTASDDAVALIMALRSPEVQVVAITTVAGNVAVAQATRNALYVTGLCGSDVPVFPGAAKPLWRELTTAEWFHGRDGLGDHNYPPADRLPQPTRAVDALISAIHANPGLMIVTLGPLTNLALALAQEPAIATMIGRCVIMGGNPVCEGNVTPAAEYNIWVDPEAARIVFRSGLPIELVGWHLCRFDAALNRSDIDRILSLPPPLAQFAIECNSMAREAYRTQTGAEGISLPDPVAMSIALDPAICTSSSRHHVEIEIASELTRGMTVVDRLGVSQDARNQGIWKSAGMAQVCWTLDTGRWKEALYRAFDSGQ